MNRRWPQSSLLHLYPSPFRTDLAGWVRASPAPDPTTKAGPSSSQALNHHPLTSSSWSFYSVQQQTTCLLLLTRARWVAGWYDASCPCTTAFVLVRTFSLKPCSLFYFMLHLQDGLTQPWWTVTEDWTTSDSFRISDVLFEVPSVFTIIGNPISGGHNIQMHNDGL